MPYSSTGQSLQGGSIVLALPVVSKGSYLQEPSATPVTSFPRSVDEPSPQNITSVGTSLISVNATSISQDLAPVTQSQTRSIPDSRLGSPSPIGTFPSTTGRLSLEVQPTQFPSGNLSSALKFSALISTTASLPSMITSAPVSADASGLLPEPPSIFSSNTTFPAKEIPTSLPSKTTIIWAPTLTVTTMRTSRYSDSIIGGSIAAGVAILLLCVLFLSLYLIRHKYKRHKLARGIAPSSDRPIGSASSFVSEPLHVADTLERQRRSITPSITVFNKKQHTTTLNPYSPERASYALQAQISTPTSDTTSLPLCGEGSSSVRNVHSRGSSFSGENYYNSVLEDFTLPYLEYARTDHPEHVGIVHGMASNSNVRSTSRVTAVPRELDSSAQIGIAI